MTLSHPDDNLFTMKHLFVCMGFLLALCGCNTAIPPTVSTSSATQQSPATRPDAITMLHNLPLPNDWKAIPGDCGQNVACIFSQQTYTGSNDAIDHGVLYAHPIAPEQCDASYAKTQSAQDGDDKDASKPFVLAGASVGYTWLGFAGAGVMPGDKPNMRFVCIHHALPNMDIEISSFSKDAPTLDYIDNMLIPFWMNLQ